MKQWQLFSPELLQQRGYDSNWYPYKNNLQQYQISNIWAKYKNFLYVGCKQARRHVDGENNLSWVAILVVRNDGFIAKPYEVSRFKLEPQKPGTVLILNIHTYHHCIRDRRMQLKDDGYWIGVSQEFPKKPSTQEVETVFREFVNNVSIN